MSNLKKASDSPAVITKTVSIPTVNDVKDFVEIACRHNCSSTLISGRFAIDAKSIMGVFSLDVSHPLTLELELNKNGGEDDRSSFVEAITPYVVND